MCCSTGWTNTTKKNLIKEATKYEKIFYVQWNNQWFIVYTAKFVHNSIVNTIWSHRVCDAVYNSL